MSKKILISIDPSSTCTGWAVFEYDDKTCQLVDSGCWKLKVKRNPLLEDRINCLYDNICALSKEWSPDVAVYEKPNIFTQSKHQSASTQIAYRKAVDACKAGVWSMVGRNNCCGVTVADWKDTKSKKTTINEINLKYNLKLTIDDNDQADAIGIADEYLQRLDSHRQFKHDNQ